MKIYDKNYITRLVLYIICWKEGRRVVFIVGYSWVDCLMIHESEDDYVRDLLLLWLGIQNMLRFCN